MEIQWLIEEIINQRINIWMHQEYDQEFRVCANREWWERLGLREEVDRLEKSLNNR